MYTISSFPNYIFTSAAAVETYYLTNKFFDNIKEINIKNNLVKYGVLIAVKSALIIGTAALTTQYPLAVTISLLAMHLLSLKNKTDSTPPVGSEESFQVAQLPKMVENNTQTNHPPKMVERETQIAIALTSKETSVTETEIFLSCFENELSNLSNMAEFDRLPPNIIKIINDLSNEIVSLKKCENLNYRDMETKLFPNVKLLFKTQILNNFKLKLENFYKNSNSDDIKEEDFRADLKEELTLNFSILKFFPSFIEFQKRDYFINSYFSKAYFDKLLNPTEKLLAATNAAAPIIDLRSDIFFLEMELYWGKGKLVSPAPEENTNEGQATNNQKINKLPGFLEAFKYSNTDQIITRKDIANEILLQLNKRQLKHTILIGKAGSGKTTILENVVDKISNRSRFKNFSFFKLDATAFVGGTSHVGEQEKRIQKMKEFFHSLKEKDPEVQIVLIIDEIHQLTGMGTSSNCSNDVWQSLKEDLGNSKFTIIGTTTEEEYETYIKKDSAVASRFSTITVPELTSDEYNQILMAKAEDCIKQYNLQISAKDLIEKVQEKQKTLFKETNRNTRQFIHCIQTVCSELELKANGELFE